jgi:hypothetical protein
MHREQTRSDTGCPDTPKLQMAAKTGICYNFGCRIDINAIPTAKVGFPGTANALAANRKCYMLSRHPQITNGGQKPEVVINLLSLSH